MLNAPLRLAAKLVLRLRYRTKVIGLEQVVRGGTRGVLFLPNHPALIDPLLVVAHLHKHFAPRSLADREQVDRFGIRWFAGRLRVIPISDLDKYAAGGRALVEAVVNECVAALERGENMLLYPSGHLYRSRLEDLRGNSAVEMILQRLPDVRIVLVRTRGVWGSSFSYASGEVPNFWRAARHGMWAALKSLIFFMPRRDVTIELFEPADLPRAAGRNEINAYLERFYNQDAPSALYVPYTPWERGGRRELADPLLESGGAAAVEVPESTRQVVYVHLRELTGRGDLRDDHRLAYDLGLDSLARAELVVWVGREFGFHVGDAASLRTVGDVLLAARGQAGGLRPVPLKPVPRRWFRHAGQRRLSVPPGETITEVFLRQARQRPGHVAVADQISGAKTYRDLVTAVFALRPQIEELRGERIGIILPASVAAVVTYLTALFAGKTPLLANWTTGARNMLHALEVAGVQKVITSAALAARIESQGVDLTELRPRFVYLEELGERIAARAKLAAWLTARLSWSSLARVQPPQIAAILQTSGSEALPKVVPLSHANLLANMRDVLAAITVSERDRLIGFLPPFHSFGLTVTMLLPLLSGMPVVYHANPTEGWVLARLVELYRPTIVVGTPTFLAGILRSAGPGQLRSLRLAVTGAEKCPQRTYTALREACTGLVVLEGYGVTECSPVVAANPQDEPREGTIGKLLASLEHAIVDVETWQPAAPGAVGMLLVRGPSVFSGYLGRDVASPFVEFAGQTWYRTGDLVSEDADGYLTFRGRLKRFVKLGGEMISLPAIEAVLEQHYASAGDEKPVVAVEATPSEEHAEIVLFTTLEIDRATANAHIRDAQLSPLHNVARVIRLDEMPVLASGKTDYRVLRESLAADYSTRARNAAASRK